MRRRSLFLAFAFTALHRPSPPSTAQSSDVILATTTSTRDAGLLDSLLPVFERQTRYRVKVIAVGSGQALAMGRRGDADVVLSHAPEVERALADSGYFVRRRLVMHNEFLVVGPAADPAGVRGLSDAVAAFRRIAGAHAAVVSRGDQSGTRRRAGAGGLLRRTRDAGADRRVRASALRPEPVRPGRGQTGPLVACLAWRQACHPGGGSP